jgi:hypothetical protein
VIWGPVGELYMPARTIFSILLIVTGLLLLGFSVLWFFWPKEITYELYAVTVVLLPTIPIAGGLCCIYLAISDRKSLSLVLTALAATLILMGVLLTGGPPSGILRFAVGFGLVVSSAFILIAANHLDRIKLSSGESAEKFGKER